MRPLLYVKVTSSTIDCHEDLVRAGPLKEANPFGVSLGGRDFKPVDISRGSAVSDNEPCAWGLDAKKKLGTLSVKAKQRCRWAWGQRCTDGWSGASWSVNQSCVRFQAIPATTVAATIVSAAIQAVTGESCLLFRGSGQFPPTILRVSLAISLWCQVAFVLGSRLVEIHWSLACASSARDTVW